MNITLPANNASNSIFRTVLASALNAILTHSRALDGQEITYAPAAAPKAPGVVARTVAMLTESSEARAQRLQEAYLAEATDIYELEFRSREWDRKVSAATPWA